MLLDYSATKTARAEISMIILDTNNTMIERLVVCDAEGFKSAQKMTEGKK